MYVIEKDYNNNEDYKLYTDKNGGLLARFNSFYSAALVSRYLQGCQLSEKDEAEAKKLIKAVN